MTYNVEEDREKLLLVKGKEVINDRDYARSLAKAIDACIAKHQKAVLRCVGKISIDNAIRAISIARYNSIRRGQSDPDSGGNLITSPEFIDVSFSDLDTSVKGVVLVVYKDKTNTEPSNSLKSEVDFDDILLKVRGIIGKKDDIISMKKEKKVYINRLSEAIIACLDKYERAILRYRGFSACDNSIKSLLMAIESIDQRNVIFEPEFTSIKMISEDGDEYTCSAVNLRVRYI